MSESKQSQKVPSSLDPIERILAWSHQAEGYEAVPWDRMPEIDLYMDQVITYMAVSYTHLDVYKRQGYFPSIESGNPYQKMNWSAYPKQKRRSQKEGF